MLTFQVRLLASSKPPREISASSKAEIIISYHNKRCERHQFVVFYWSEAGPRPFPHTQEEEITQELVYQEVRITEVVLESVDHREEWELESDEKMFSPMCR